jgi:hypothetical protein
LLFALIGGVRRCSCKRNFSGIAILLFFTMSRIDFAGEFRREAINNNGLQNHGFHRAIHISVIIPISAREMLFR